MSDRIGDYRDPFWNARDRRIQKAHLDAIAARGRIQDSDAKIARKRREEHAQARAEQRRALAEELGRDKARLVIALSAVTVPMKDRWTSSVEQLDLTGSSALDELAQLRQAVELYRRVYTPHVRTVSPELSRSPVMMRLQHEEEDRAERARATAAELDAVLPRLADVVDAVQRYRSA